MKRGFTLIELLVVIAIIGVLSSVVLVSLNTARGKARDAKVRSELRQIQTAVQLYYDRFGAMPPNTYPGNYCSNQPNFLQVTCQAIQWRQTIPPIRTAITITVLEVHLEAS
jgi:prepilin-type N-terminal cleavage/methylation domain-containing protein